VGLPDIHYGADLIPQQRWMNQLVLRHAGRVLCGCEHMAQAARARVGRSHHNKIEVVPLGVNLARFPARMERQENGTGHFMNVGSLEPVKDQATLLRAFARVLEQLAGASLTIVGTGRLERELAELARDLNIQRNVTLAGSVRHDQLAPLYHSADVFVQSSKHEGQGMALLEAAACGVAVAGTNVGALADLVREGAAIPSFKQGFPKGDESAVELANAMVKAYYQRAELRARASRIIEREYNLDHIRARLEKRYTDACGRTDVAFGADTARA
jgi:glycosyltransferase involved in cell wall biosynthesis